MAERMTDRQRVALLNPRATARGLQDNMFWRRIEVRGRFFSSILTVNK